MNIECTSLLACWGHHDWPRSAPADHRSGGECITEPLSAKNPCSQLACSPQSRRNGKLRGPHPGGKRLCPNTDNLSGPVFSLLRNRSTPSSGAPKFRPVAVPFPGPRLWARRPESLWKNEVSIMDNCALRGCTFSHIPTDQRRRDCHPRPPRKCRPAISACMTLCCGLCVAWPLTLS